MVPLVERIGAHSHIKGLGIDAENQGIIGMITQRKALMVVKKMAEINTRGRIILLVGGSGTGKSALLAGLLLELKRSELPFASISASEIFSSSLSYSEILTQNLRQAIGVQIKENSKVLEGEVVDVQINRETGSTGKIILKTTDTEGVFTLGEQMIHHLYEEKVETGDIVRVNKTTGTLRKIGRSASKAKDVDLIGPNTQYVPVPEGELLKVKEESHLVSFHEIDIINTKSKGYQELMCSTTEIPAEVRDGVDASMKEWIDEGRAYLKTGVLIINESHLLNPESYSFLNTVVEMHVAPIVILVTAEKEEPQGSIKTEWPQGSNKTEGTQGCTKFAVPSDFLSRALVVRTDEHTPEDLMEIIRVRAAEESVDLQAEALEQLSLLAQAHGIRYAFNLLAASDVVSQRTSRAVSPEMIKSLSEMFKSV